MKKFLQLLCTTMAIAVGIGIVQNVAADDKEEPKRSLEIRHTMTIEAKSSVQQRCAAQLSFTYYQKDTVAVVESALNNSDCGASGGEYTVLVRFRDENNELQSLEYPETWHRDDDQDINSVKEYSIGENVDLVSVRTRKLRCVCDKTAMTQEISPE